jgi:hypothetical protein
MKKHAADPAKDLKFDGWHSPLAAVFAMAKPGVQEAALIAQGCRMAMYKRRVRVIAWPITGETLNKEEPIGYIIMDYQARLLDVYNRDGKVVDHVPKKATFGSEKGLIGFDAIRKLQQPEKIEMVWKVEGITDQAALWAAIPEKMRDRHAVITTSNGCDDKPDWRANLLAQCNVNMIHDCDESGQRSAEKWAEAIARRQGSGKWIRNIVLPFDITPDHGMDLRDFLNG